MPRTTKDQRLDTASIRNKLKPKPGNEPYWRVLDGTTALGYRPVAGTWIARRYTAMTGRKFHSLGNADDEGLPANGETVLSYTQAKDAADAWFKRMDAVEAGEQPIDDSYNVGNAMDDYLKHSERKKRKVLDRTRSVIDTHIKKAHIAPVPLSRLKRQQVQSWFDAVADAKPIIRTKDKKVRATRDIDTSNPEVLRARHSTANRILTVLKAGLNWSLKQGKVETDAAWKTVAPFRSVDSAKQRYLQLNEIEKLIDKAAADFALLCKGALLTGCRYEELCVMLADAFNADANSVHIKRSKSGKERWIPLSAEGVSFFTKQAEKKKSVDFMFAHSDGRAWLHSQQTYHMNAACEDAKIEPIGFHGLRHTYASHLAMASTPMAVIASLLGHSDTRQVDKHYAHLAPNYVADTLRANLPNFGFKPSQPENDPEATEQASGHATGPKLAIVKGRKAS
jgi:integrase